MGLIVVRTCSYSQSIEQKSSNYAESRVAMQEKRVRKSRSECLVSRVGDVDDGGHGSKQRKFIRIMISIKEKGALWSATILFAL